MKYISDKFDLKETLKKWYETLKPIPSGSLFILDICFIFLFLILYFILNNFIIHRICCVDIITPWLFIYHIKQRSEKSFTLFLISAFCLETHMNMPKGTYFCSYFIIWACLFLVKNRLSWTQLSTWVCGFLISFCIIMIYILVTLVVVEEKIFLSWGMFARMIGYLVLSTLVGIGYLKIYNRIIDLNLDFRQFGFKNIIKNVH